MQDLTNFTCPNCDSTKYFGKTSIGKKYKDGPYKDVNSEIQCSRCFMDIPSNISENINKINLNNCKRLWNEVYKPVHKLDAAKCTKCNRFYWEIEKYLFNNNIFSKDIFYQVFNPQKGAGDLVCKICDPSAFK
tara:strand:+ start:13 stop:411 length:399 start_codon:yes stop_codon:yes gene_type:complete